MVGAFEAPRRGAVWVRLGSGPFPLPIDHIVTYRAVGRGRGLAPPIRNVAQLPVSDQILRRVRLGQQQLQRDRAPPEALTPERPLSIELLHVSDDMISSIAAALGPREDDRPHRLHRGEPPPGPAIPLMATATSAPLRVSAPCAMPHAQSRSKPSRRSRCTSMSHFQKFVLHIVGIGHKTASRIHRLSEPANFRQRRSDEAAGAAFRQRHRGDRYGDVFGNDHARASATSVIGKQLSPENGHRSFYQPCTSC
jgi:hypothetical protein